MKLTLLQWTSLTVKRTMSDKDIIGSCNRRQLLLGTAHQFASVRTHVLFLVHRLC